MFKKKKKPPTIGELTNRLRGFMLDSQIQNGNELAILLGCSPISDELLEREEEESEKRTDRIGYLTPLIYAFSHTLSEAAVEYQRENFEGAEKLPAEIWTASRRMLEQATISVMMGSLSQFVDMGLLNVPKEKK
ncbi:hypothetical protein UFOVP45_64 [uncultured Caudovirales phage]|uniref:Uncharacterized protein n=1 Tax=uncultured Caudovirales phage TaxID=2100421 RepID=A0A6J5KPX1_9CAUD|nr:hypothetical protein UFOVP45_64 [uncultured Caudovirales phage]